MLEQTPNLDFYQEMVNGLLIEGDSVVGVKTSLGLEIRAKAVADVTGVMNQILKDGYANGEIAFSDFPAIAKIVFDLLFSLPNYET